MIELCCVYSSVRWIWLYIIIIMSRTSLRDNKHSIVRLNVTEVLPRSRRHIWSLSDSNKIWIYNDLVSKPRLKYLFVWCIWLYLIIMSRAGFRVNWHFMVCLSVKDLLDWSRRHIWKLSDCNEILTKNCLVRRRTLYHLAKPAKWLKCVVSSYLYGAFDCMLLSCQVRDSEWIHTI